MLSFHKSLDLVLRFFIRLQKKYYMVILLVGLALTVVCAKPAIKLLTSVATDLINLLPENYPSVKLSDQIKKKFNRRSSMFVILHSPSPEANEKAIHGLKEFLEKNESVDRVEIKKEGYEFIDQNKLLLIDLSDIYTAHDKLKDKIQKEKLGGLYIDFEDGESEESAGSVEDLLSRYREQFTQGVESEYRRNVEGTVYVADVYPKSTDSSLSFFKTFGQGVDRHLKNFDFKKYHPEMEYGYAGAIITRVDQYDALMEDLKRAGVISLGSIFLLLYLYFSRYIRHQKGLFGFLKVSLIRLVPVTIVFLPMIFSTMMAFAFCSLFIDQLNVVTSFLFAIIFGLGVDIGIHLVSRYIQDRNHGLAMDAVHENVVRHTGRSCVTSILTTVASFYILILTDFKGFSEFGWIAGNGLVIALLSYLVFQPCFILFVNRFHLLGRKTFAKERPLRVSRNKMPYAKPLLLVLILLAAFSAYDTKNVGFEWDFDKLKMKLAHRQYQKGLLKETIGRVNSPAAYLVENRIEARAIGQVLREKKVYDNQTPTIDFYRSYYDMFPLDQEEKMAVWQDIGVMLEDDALNTLKKEDRELLDDLKKEIKGLRLIQEGDITPEIYETFWGNTGSKDESIAYVMPLPELELDNGNNATAFYHDVAHVQALGKNFHAVSDSIVFAEVLITLFRDAKIAVSLSALVLMVLIFLHYRSVKKTFFVLLGLTCGVFWMFAFMDLFNLKLNFYNMIIIPAVMGMGVDNSVHLLDRFEEMKRASIMKALKTAGGAALAASLTTMLGYLGLGFTQHPGLNSIGWMAIAGMGTCLVGSLVVLPLLLQVFLKPNE